MGFESLELPNEEPLNPALLHHLETKKGFKEPSPIQLAVVPLFAGNKDVAVEACTGSGKTLAYLLPVFIRLLREQLVNERQVHLLWVHTLILAPTRELVMQITEVAREILADIREFDDTLLERCRIVELYGGRKSEIDRKIVCSSAGPRTLGVVVATPGRLRSQVLELKDSTLRRDKHWSFRFCEMLIIDEADQLFADTKAQEEMRVCLSVLPRQRRTGIFSATLTSEARALTLCGMRNPKFIKLSLEDAAFSAAVGETASTTISALPELAGATTDAQFEDEDATEEEFEEAMSDLEDQETRQGDVVNGGIKDTFECDSEEEVAVVAHFVPIGLRNYYMFAEQDERIPLLVKILESEDYHKVLVFTATCASTDFTYSVLTAFYEKSRFAAIIKLHGKLDRSKRKRALYEFGESERVKTEAGDVQKRVMIASDLAARGIDFEGIDLIIQLDPPNDPSQTFHRMGRTARAGGRGDALMLLSPNEDTFLSFMANKGINFTEGFPLKSWSEGRNPFDDSAAKLPPPLPEDASERKLYVHSYIRELLKTDKALFEKAKEAFVSLVRSYKEHQLSFVFVFLSLDIGRVANRFGLFEIPALKEIKRKRPNGTMLPSEWPSFIPSDFDPSQIQFKDPQVAERFASTLEHRRLKREKVMAQAKAFKEKKLEMLKAKRSASARRKRKREISLRELRENVEDNVLMRSRKRKLLLLKTKGLKPSKIQKLDDTLAVQELEEELRKEE